jgi:hypothetical protein
MLFFQSRWDSDVNLEPVSRPTRTKRSYLVHYGIEFLCHRFLNTTILVSLRPNCSVPSYAATSGSIAVFHNLLTLNVIRFFQREYREVDGRKKSNKTKGAFQGKNMDHSILLTFKSGTL